MRERLKRELEKHGGVLSYADYMKLVLYDHKEGYYQREKEKIGKQGDFLTTSSVSYLYGILIYQLFKRLVKKGKISPLFIELGSGDGAFLRSFFEAWEEDEEHFSFSVIAVERSVYHRQKIRESLPYENLTILEDISEVDIGLKGFMFSNELFDALPVHVIEKRGQDIFELFVTEDEQGGLVEKAFPLEHPEIKTILQKGEVFINDGQRLEVSLSMKQLLKEISEKVSGVMMTVDYGYFDEDYEKPHLKSGSLRGYYKHQLIQNVLLYPFEMDITSHVHFGWFERIMNKLGWNDVYRKEQSQFLVDVGLLRLLASHTSLDPFSPVAKRNRAILTLLTGAFNNAFHVFIHTKGVMLSKEDLTT